MDASLATALNTHLALEYAAFHDYAAMAVWLDLHDLPGIATWMKGQSAAELTHAARIVDHLVERDVPVTLPGIPQPPSEWESVRALFENVLASERAVTASIHALAEQADRAGDRAAGIMLQWFVSEQVEEEGVARAILGRLRLAGESGVGLLMLDQELAAGTVPGAPPEPGA